MLLLLLPSLFRPRRRPRVQPRPASSLSILSVNRAKRRAMRASTRTRRRSCPSGSPSTACTALSCTRLHASISPFIHPSNSRCPPPNQVIVISPLSGWWMDEVMEASSCGGGRAACIIAFHSTTNTSPYQLRARRLPPSHCRRSESLAHSLGRSVYL